jgi:hypothetical protein
MTGGAQYTMDREGGGKERGEHEEPILGLTGARAAVWRLGNNSKVVMEVELGSGGAQAQRGKERYGEDRQGHLLL